MPSSRFSNVGTFGNIQELPDAPKERSSQDAGSLYDQRSKASPQEISSAPASVEPSSTLRQVDSKRSSGFNLDSDALTKKISQDGPVEDTGGLENGSFDKPNDNSQTKQDQDNSQDREMLDDNPIVQASNLPTQSPDQQTTTAMPSPNPQGETMTVPWLDHWPYGLLAATVIAGVVIWMRSSRQPFRARSRQSKRDSKELVDQAESSVSPTRGQFKKTDRFKKSLTDSNQPEHQEEMQDAKEMHDAKYPEQKSEEPMKSDLPSDHEQEASQTLDASIDSDEFDFSFDENEQGTESGLNSTSEVSSDVPSDERASDLTTTVESAPTVDLSLDLDLNGDDKVVDLNMDDDDLFGQGSSGMTAMPNDADSSVGLKSPQESEPVEAGLGELSGHDEPAKVVPKSLDESVDAEEATDELSKTIKNVSPTEAKQAEVLVSETIESMESPPLPEAPVADSPPPKRSFFSRLFGFFGSRSSNDSNGEATEETLVADAQPIESEIEGKTVSTYSDEELNAATIVADDMDAEGESGMDEFDDELVTVPDEDSWSDSMADSSAKLGSDEEVVEIVDSFDEQDDSIEPETSAGTSVAEVAEPEFDLDDEDLSLFEDGDLPASPTNTRATLADEECSEEDVIVEAADEDFAEANLEDQEFAVFEDEMLPASPASQRATLVEEDDGIVESESDMSMDDDLVAEDKFEAPSEVTELIENPSTTDSQAERGIAAVGVSRANETDTTDAAYKGASVALAEPSSVETVVAEANSIATEIVDVQEQGSAIPSGLCVEPDVASANSEFDAASVTTDDELLFRVEPMPESDATAHLDGLQTQVDALTNEKIQLQEELEAANALVASLQDQKRAESESHPLSVSEQLVASGAGAAASAVGLIGEESGSGDSAELADLKSRFGKKIRAERRRRKEAEAFLEEAEVQRNQVSASLRESKSKNKDLESKVEALTQQLSELSNQARVASEHELDKLRQENEKFRRELEQLILDQSSLQDDLATTKEREQKLEDLSEQTRVEVEELQRENVRLSSELDKKIAVSEELQERVEQFEIDSNSEMSNQGATESDRESELQEQLVRMQQRAEEAESRLNLASSEFQNAALAPTPDADELESLREAMRMQQTEFTKAIDQLNSVLELSRTSKASQDESSLVSQLKGLWDQQRSNDETLSSIKSEMVSLVAQSVNAQQANHEDSELAQGLMTKIAKLETQIESEREIRMDAQNQLEDSRRQVALLEAKVGEATNQNETQTNFQQIEKLLSERMDEMSTRLSKQQEEQAQQQQQLLDHLSQAVVHSPSKGRKKISAGSNELTQLDGVGKAIAKKLNDVGITRLDQIAKWSPEDIESIEQKLSIQGKVSRFDWVGQAKRLLG